jgi:riboflavin synthase
MFTGLIAETGRVVSLAKRGSEGLLSVACDAVVADARKGDSIAVDGACVTVETFDAKGFTAFLSAETLARTTLGDLRPGQAVNLEAALRPGDRLGGHMVQGHVEGVGRVLSLSQVGEGAALAVEIPEDLAEAVIPKGSIALAGVSLTVASHRGARVEVAVIPATLKASTLGSWRAGDRVNVETDMVGRYIVAYLKRLRPGRDLSMEELLEKGF